MSNRINNFSIPFLVQLFSNQLSTVLIDVKNTITVFEEKMIKENQKKVSKIIEKTLTKEQWINIDDLAQQTNLHYDLLLKLKDSILEENKTIGFVDNRFVTYSLDILKSGYDFLENLMNTIYQKISNNDSFELKADFEQSLENCDFLIRGFQILNEQDYLESVLLKKETLIEERKQIFGI